MANLPNIEITFTQLAATLVERSETGTAVLIVKDATASDGSVMEYKDITEVLEDESVYTPESLQALKDVTTYAVGKLVVMKIAEDGNIGEALQKIEAKYKNCWITVLNTTEEDTATLVSWIKAKENERKQYKAIVYKGIAMDCKHLVNLVNETVTFKDDREKQSGAAFLPTLLGILASCNIKRGTTYYKCDTLSEVEEPEDIQSEIDKGSLVLINDEGMVRIGVGINTLITTDGKTATEDMKFIETVEAMDQIQLDIYTTFKNEYVGNYRNNEDNQMLFISAVNGYLDGLAQDDVLDANYENVVEIDVETQRKAWIASGKAEAKEWDDKKVREMAYKRSLFLKGDIKILGSMQDMKLNINLA